MTTLNHRSCCASFALARLDYPQAAARGEEKRPASLVTRYSDLIDPTSSVHPALCRFPGAAVINGLTAVRFKSLGRAHAAECEEARIAVPADDHYDPREVTRPQRFIPAHPSGQKAFATMPATNAASVEVLCRSCRSACRRSARRRWWDQVLSWLGWYPWRCGRCSARFYARRR